MIALLSGAWWVQKLTGVVAQAALLVSVIGALALGLAWLRHDARMEERASWEVKMANARAQELLLRQRREKQSYAIGARAEKDLLQELDPSDSIINGLEKKLAERAACSATGRVICYPANVTKELNK